MSVIGPFTLTYDQMREFLSLYDKEQKFPEQRFGQAFCNHFNLVWPEMFYQRDREEAERIIYETVVK